MKKAAFVRKLVLALSLCLAVQGSAPRRAEAIVGIVALNPLMVLGGVALVGASPFAAYYGFESGLRSFIRGRGVKLESVLLFWSSPFLLAGGIVLLDGPGGALRFEPVDDAKAERLRLTTEQASAYNEHVDELNGLVETVSRDAAGASGDRIDAARDLVREYARQSGIPDAAVEGFSMVAAAAVTEVMAADGGSR